LYSYRTIIRGENLTVLAIFIIHYQNKPESVDQKWFSNVPSDVRDEETITHKIFTLYLFLYYQRTLALEMGLEFNFTGILGPDICTHAEQTQALSWTTISWHCNRELWLSL